MQRFHVILTVIFLLSGSVLTISCSKHDDGQSTSPPQETIPEQSSASEHYDFLDPTIDDLPAILEDIGGSDPATCERARDAINILLRKPEAIGILAEASRDVYSPLHEQAEQAFQYSGQRRSLAPSLVDSLWGEDSQIRYTGEIDKENPGLDPDIAVPILIQALHAQDPLVRSSALDILGMLGADATPAIPDIIDILKNEPMDYLRGAAAITLNRIGVNRTEVIEALIAALDDPYWQVRGFALNALVTVCPQDARLPELMNVLFYDDTIYVKTAAVSAMVKTGHTTPDVIGFLTDQLGSDKAIVRQMAAQSLGDIGPAAGNALPALGQLLDKEEDQSVTDAIRRAIDLIEGQRAD